MRTKQRSLGLRPVLLLAGSLLVLAACHDEPARSDKDDRPALPVQVSAVTETSWRESLEVAAGVVPFQRAMPGTVLMGRVEEVLVQEGDRVARGHTLARIQSKDVAARVAQAEAGVVAAQAMERNAKLMRERMERLRSREAASQKNLDDAVAGYDAALAHLRAAEKEVEAARVALSHADVRAPFAGLVVEKRVETGDMAAPGMPLFLIEDVSRVKVEAQVPESAALQLEVGDAVVVEVHGESLDARLAELIPAADPRSRTFTVRAVLDNPDGRLRSGLFARMRLPGEERPSVRVPESSIVRRGPLSGLFVVRDENSTRRSRLRWVTLGRESDGQVEVLTGLRPGELLVLNPPATLEDGRRVEAR
jgi:RND family efflux transporter MFP subunit